MSQPLWTEAELRQAGLRIEGNPCTIRGASIDTRTLEPGDLFFAIEGNARDGHDFVEAALDKGAAAAVVSQARAAAFAGAGPLVVAPDVLDAMRILGRAARARSEARIVAVTGSVGKTGTKEALLHVLSRQGETHASVASYNNHWGVPLTLARMPREAAYGVFEIGMNHIAEIAPLTRMVRPQVAVITTVEPVHIAYFRSLASIADAKGEIFGGLETGGTAILNRDNPHYERMLAHALASPAGRILTFGEHAAADIRAHAITAEPDGIRVEATILGRPLAYRIGTPGRHVALNSLAVLASCLALGADVDAAAAALADLTPPVGRGQRTRLSAQDGEFLLIDESYNANPASMRAALATLGSLDSATAPRRIAVLGDMLELGENGAALHRGLAEAVEASGADLVFAAGPLMAELFGALPKSRQGGYAPSAAELEPQVLSAVRAGDAIMIKGSNGTRVHRIVASLKERFGRAAEAGSRASC